MIKVSFIIPLHNGLELTKVCLRTLQETLPAGLEHEIIFVDDVSTDGTREWLKTLPAPCRFVLNVENAGYAATNNAGAAMATGEYLALINNDLEFLPGWLEPMLAALDSDPNLGLVGNVQRRVKDDSIDHAGIRFRANAKLEHIQELPSAASIRRRPVRFVPAVTAACCIVRREVFMRPRRDGHIPAQPGFRVSYRNGGEDVDLCLNLLEWGYRVAVVLSSVVRHHVSASRGEARPHDEANSRNLFGYWRDVIIRYSTGDWAKQKLRAWREGTEVMPWRTVVTALRVRAGFVSRTPRLAWMEIGAAIFYEELHWRKVLGLPRPPVADNPKDYVLTGLKSDTLQHETQAMREKFTAVLPPGVIEKNIFINGFVLPADPDRRETQGDIGLRLTVNGIQTATAFPLPDGHFNCGIDKPLLVTDEPVRLQVELLGTDRENTLAWLGRVTARWPLPRTWRDRLERYRPQVKNRRIRISQIVCDERPIYDFKKRRPLRIEARENKEYPLGINVVGWLRAELGIGESARCMARAVAATDLPHAFVDMKLPCLNRMGDQTFAAQLQKTNPYRVNVFHIDPPVSGDIDHHHGDAFRDNRRNIAYWAWELPEFPDQWVEACQYYDEIWCPSAFVRDAIAAKVPLPVHVMPHSIDFILPEGDQRPRFDLPTDRTSFLFLYDLNSYQERKNPHAVIDAYRQAFPDEAGVHLVIKTQNPERNPAAFSRLKAALRGLKHTTLIARTLEREEVHALEAACDVFVSLHRSEGFGLAVAEAMFVGKPVVSTDWSATAEFVHAENGCPVPVDLIELSETHGPYEKGQIWANPRVADAADAMRRLAANPELRQRLGAAAARDIRAQFSPAAIGARYAKRLAAMQLWPD
ncbi:glycosyltransferase [Synoicihabitans lomoniglobus]|uniref:Glycosyltransferase n=1 Tax=Synoicihabitans lomoniglobus TaxID=2909285 RepID=A0AAF0I870_9BACT|nr:glycosyltransferase [Opitutaceae bacterium LMO-M01]WED67411.1 glycosyltransferase [Opitutaceae bacterium LMO-M01]